MLDSPYHGQITVKLWFQGCHNLTKGVTFNVLSLFIVKGTSPVLPALEREQFFQMVLLIRCFPRGFLSQDIRVSYTERRQEVWINIGLQEVMTILNPEEERRQAGLSAT